MNNLRKYCGYTLATAFVLLLLFRVLAGDGFEYSVGKTTMVTEKKVVGELLEGTVVEQNFLSEYDRILEINLLCTNYGVDVNDCLELTLLNSDGCVLAQVFLETQGLPDGKPWSIQLPQIEFDCKNQVLTLQIRSMRGVSGGTVSIYCGDSVSAGRYEIPIESAFDLYVNNNKVDGQLCMSLTGENIHLLARYYWWFAAAVLLTLALMCAYVIHCDQRGKSSFVLRMIAAGVRYNFLIKQLVSRDFKTKYKRSVLGVLWSFMNPLLTMMVMYIVFSTLFQSGIENFSVYLLTGIVCWNFFSEATASCLTSITGNSALITKVYVPKYIYPFARAVSSCVNLFMSLIPLLLVMILTGTDFTPRLLLVPFPLLCLFFLAFGMGLFLASWMVFFHDTQFLWGVVSMLWMYLTPIFYDVSIIPAKYMTLYKLNPLYHIIGVMRALMMEGCSPVPEAYLFCALAGLIPLAIGAVVFKKTQDRFVLYL